MPIRAVLWDIDDTIFDYTGADLAGMADHLAAEGLLDGFGAAEQALARWRELTDHHWARFAAGETDFEGQRRDRVRHFLGEALSDVEATAWFARYLVHFEAAWTIFPDVLPALDALPPGCRNGLLSNSSEAVQERKLRVLGIRDRFEVLVCAADLGISKPDPGAFLAACDALGLPPAEVAYVGDHAEIDARGADAAGLLGVWLDRAGAVPSPSGLRRIAGLAELPALLRANTGFGAPSPIG